jgi:uncharacterized protein
MQKIIVDTNVIVSSLIQRSYPYFIIYELFIEYKLEICISEELMSEYFAVLARPKFSKYHEFFVNAESLLIEIEKRATTYNPKTKLSIINDIKDNVLLELAEECNADFIVTGNSNDFTFSVYKGTKIVSPKDFYLGYKI